VKDKIDVLIKQLNWDNPAEIQEEAIKKLTKIDIPDLTALLQPVFGKNYWENSAKVLLKIGYPKIKNIIPGLFEWLQDMNWPGALIVREILLNLPKDALLNNYEDAIYKATSENDEEWLLNLKLFWDDYNNKSKNLRY
jgi:hypothetical protein